MGKRRRLNARGHSRESQRFVMLPHYLLNCPAWRSLDPVAMKLLLDVWRRHNGANNGEISYSCREAKDIGITKSVAERAFAELQAKGFLVNTRASSFSTKQRLARSWRLTGEAVGTAAATKDYMRWLPEKPFPTNAAARLESQPKPDDLA